MNKRLFQLLLTLIGIFSISLIGHFSDHHSDRSSAQHKIHPTYKASTTFLSYLDQSEVDTSDFEASDNQNGQALEISSFVFSFHYKEFRVIPIPFLNTAGKLLTKLPFYVIFQNFRI